MQESQVVREWESFFSNQIPEIVKKISNRKVLVVALQITLLFAGLSLALHTTYGWLGSTSGNLNYTVLEGWAESYDWLSDAKRLLMATSVLNTISLVVMLTGLCLVKRWKARAFGEHKQGRWSADKLFVIYIIFLYIVSFSETIRILLYCIDEIEEDELQGTLTRWKHQ